METKQNHKRAAAKKRKKTSRVRVSKKTTKTPEQQRTAKQNREAVRARQRREARAQKRSKAPKRPAPAVVYTQPEVFNRHKLVMRLLIVTAVVVALVLGMSIFFKVETITVSGARVYSEWTVVEASGIEEGDHLLTFSIPRASGKIIAELPYVQSVRIGIKLPDTVNIVIEELEVTYAVQSTDGLWWLISSEGKVVDQTDAGTAAGYTKVLGIYLESPLLGEQAVAFETPTAPTAETAGDANGESTELVGTEPVVVTNAQRLEVALEILQALEASDIVGEAASVDVTDLGDIELWYGTQYQVQLGDAGNLSYKISCMYSAINSEEMSTGYGVLDISFTTWPDQIGYTPFE